MQFGRTLSASEAGLLLVAPLPLYEGPENALGMPASYERAAFVSITYNRGMGAVADRMQPFYSAIRAGNRAEAWFQIRYKSLGDADPKFVYGIAKRRYVESQLFGLYDVPGSPTSSTDAKSIYAMLTKHRQEILLYESKYGVPPDVTSAIRNTIALANSDPRFSAPTTTQKLVDALTPARDAVVAWTKSLLTAAESGSIPTALNAAAIFYGGDASSASWR